MNNTRASFVIVTVSLIFYAFALATFALTPLLPEPNPIWPVEWAITILALSGVVMLVALTLNLYALITRFGALVIGAAGVLAMLAFVIAEVTVASEFRLVIGGFLMVGIFTSFSSHLLYGGADDDRGV